MTGADTRTHVVGVHLVLARTPDAPLMPLFVEAVALDVTLGEICDTLRARRDRYGVSYVTVAERYADEFAPVVAALAGS